MSTEQTPNTPPPLSAGTPPPPPAQPPAAGPPPIEPPLDEDLLDEEEQEDGADDSDESTEPAGKVNWGQKLKENKLMAGVVVLVLFLAGAYFMYQSAVQDEARVAPGNPVMVEDLTVAPIPPEAVDPLSATQQSLDRDQIKTTEVSGDTMLMSLGPQQSSVVIEPSERPVSSQQRNDYRTAAANVARANNEDSVTVTMRDPNTGQFVQKRVARQRVPLDRRQRTARQGGNSYRRSSSFSEVTPQNQYASQQPQQQLAPRPTHAPDGTPYETNDEINLMIAGLPTDVQAQYERMSGRRYRPLPANVQQQGNASRDRRSEMAYIPGMDGFNTIRYRGSNASQEEETPIPDIFFRCAVLGTQQIRTGSVVELRLQEDATFDGITYPRNMVFSALASVETNRVMLDIQRMGPHKVKVETFNYAYMPGIMIDPGKRASPTGASMAEGLQQGGFNEISQAIGQSQQAANSWQGIAGRVGVTLISRVPRAGQKLRQVTLPDGYPLLLSKASGGLQRGGQALQQGGVNSPTGLQGQSGNPMQSLLMSGQGQGGYQGNMGTVPPLYYQQAAPQR